MATTLKKRTVVICGGGFTAGLISRQLIAKNIDVLVLERGGDRSDAAEAKLPSQRDELRWDVRAGLAQDWAVQTYSLRHSRDDEALPIRRLAAFLPGEGVGGAANHWNGQTWRWAEYDPVMRTRLETRYGKKAIPAEMTIQDWGVTYAELEPYHALWEKLFGIAGKAGNLRGEIQVGGNPFEAPRQDEYPQPPLPATESGLFFIAAAESLGYKPFPMAAANSPAAYTNPDGMRLGQCQFCGHCERFICEAKAKASPEVLLYPMLLKRPSFELRTQCHVLGVDYDRDAKRVRGVRYLDLMTGEEYEQPADIIVLASFTMSNTKYMLMSGIGTPYDPRTGIGNVGRNFCHQTMSGLNRVLQGPLAQSVLRVGGVADLRRRIQRGQFRSQRPRLLRRRLHLLERDERPADSTSVGPTGHAQMGNEVEAGERRLVRARLQHLRAWKLVPPPRELSRSRSYLSGRVRPAACAHDVRHPRERAAHVGISDEEGRGDWQGVWCDDRRLPDSTQRSI